MSVARTTVVNFRTFIDTLAYFNSREAQETLINNIMTSM